MCPIKEYRGKQWRLARGLKEHSNTTLPIMSTYSTSHYCEIAPARLSVSYRHSRDQCTAINSENFDRTTSATKGDICSHDRVELDWHFRFAVSIRMRIDCTGSFGTCNDFTSNTRRLRISTMLIKPHHILFPNSMETIT